MINEFFSEQLYAEMAAFVPREDEKEILLFHMPPCWEERFRKDFVPHRIKSVPSMESLPGEWHGKFSSVLFPPGIEEIPEPEALLESIKPFLAIDGGVVVPFRNPWHWSVFSSWFSGDLRYGSNPLLMGQGRLFAFSELLRLAQVAHYGDFTVRQIQEKGEPEFLSRLSELGIRNGHGELETTWWIIRISELSEETARLKQKYTPEVRHRLARLLHRIESEIETEENLAALIRLLKENGIPREYLMEFVKNASGAPRTFSVRLMQQLGWEEQAGEKR